MKIGIVGAEAAKFTPETEHRAKEIIHNLLSDGDIVVSGHCHLGGIDIWAEETADNHGYDKLIFPPKRLQWSGGYKERNILIAKNSDLVVCIAVEKLPVTYNGMRFESCYHCGNSEPLHVKSGGCWTTKYARKLGKETKLYIVRD